MEETPNPNSLTELGVGTSNNELDDEISTGSSSQNSNPNPNPNPDEIGLNNFTEDQLKEKLLTKLENTYYKALLRLVEKGTDRAVALKAILTHVFCFGDKDVFTNICCNCTAYLFDTENFWDLLIDKPVCDDSDFRLLGKSCYGLVTVLQHAKPCLSRGDVMRCLLLSDLDVGRAALMELPRNVESLGQSTSPVWISPSLCRFIGDTEFLAVNGLSEMTLENEIECPARSNLGPLWESLLRRNVAIFATWFRGDWTQLQPESLDEELVIGEDQDGVDSILDAFRGLNLDENRNVGEEEEDYQKDETVLIHWIKDLEREVKERRDWAQQKAIQAARKVSEDLIELMTLRREKEETGMLYKRKRGLGGDTTMNRFSEMVIAVSEASGEVERVNAKARELETENAEIRAEMEAFKLSASESESKCLEIRKREIKCLKRLSDLEKLITKLQTGIAVEKEKILELQQELANIRVAQEEAEVKWRQEQMAKELAKEQIAIERRLKKETEIDNPRKHDLLLQNMEREIKRHKDEHQRLDQELSQLKVSAQSTTEVMHQSMKLPSKNPVHASTEEIIGDRKCFNCEEAEISVVFLPCAHQVLCSKCDDLHAKTVKSACPCCAAPIKERIRVFGASSSSQ